MPLPNLPVPPFANVPIAAGVPDLVRAVGSRVVALGGPLAEQAVAYLQADGILSGVSITKPHWGVFDGTTDALNADSIGHLEYRGDSRISDYPQEQGSFQSYNKTGLPASIALTATKGKKLDDRTSFVKALESMKTSTATYSVITPELTYSNMNLTRVEYRRSAESGSNMIIADLYFEEVRIAAAAAFTNTKDPSGAAVQNIGAVQAQPLTAGQAAAVHKGPPV